MSAQNNLKKPVFTKTVMGYTPKEVDQYIEYMNERYAAVSRDVAELRRRLTRYQLGLDKVEPEVQTPASAGFSEAALDKLRHMISAERSRHGEALDALLEFIENHKDGEAVREKVVMDMSDGFVPLDDESEPEKAIIDEIPEAATITDEDEEWKAALESFIADAESEEAAEEPVNADEGEAGIEYNAAARTDLASEADAESSEDELSIDSSFEAPVEDEPAEASAERAKTPAEIAMELDFYSDDVVRDGESYDPMTLAQSVTMQKKRPTIEDFMAPLENGEKPKIK